MSKRLEYIPLETDSRCLVHTIAVLHVSDSLIFVGDYYLGLYVFDRRGKFLRKNGSVGRGPGEYMRLYDFAVDHKNKEISVLSGRELFVYDFDGKFKRDVLLGFPSHRLVLTEDNARALLPFSYAKTTDRPVYSIYVLSRQKKTILKIPGTSKRVKGAFVGPI